MWSARQARDIAKDIVRAKFSGCALKFLTGEVRCAIVSAWVFGIVRGQMAQAVEVAAMDALLRDVMAAVCASEGTNFFD